MQVRGLCHGTLTQGKERSRGYLWEFGPSQPGLSVREAQSHGDGGFVGIAVVTRASAGLRKAVFAVKRQGALVRFTDLEEESFELAFATFGKCCLQEGGSVTFAPPVGSDGEVEKLHFLGGFHRANSNEAEEDFAIANDPAVYVAYAKFECAGRPLSGFRTGPRKKENFR